MQESGLHARFAKLYQSFKKLLRSVAAITYRQRGGGGIKCPN